MGARVQMPPAEYLATSFEGPDREYRSGEVIERVVGDKLHSRMQFRLAAIFAGLEGKHAVFGYTELRLRLSPLRYLIPDLSVFAGEEPAERVPSTSPLIVVEIVSPDDRLTDLIQKLEEYRDWGVRHVWMIDPGLRRLYVCDGDGLRQVQTLALPEFGVELHSGEVF